MIHNPDEFKMNAMEAIREARRLHEQLAADHTSREEKTSLARRISGLLFAAEASARLPDSAKVLFLRLRTDTHFRAGSDRSERLRDPAELWEHYSDLESAAEKCKT